MGVSNYLFLAISLVALFFVAKMMIWQIQSARSGQLWGLQGNLPTRQANQKLFWIVWAGLFAPIVLIGAFAGQSALAIIGKLL